MCGEKENEIKFICGDVLEVYFAVDGIDKELISTVHFSCIGAGILCELPYWDEEEAYCLKFNSRTSADIQPGFYTYDVTVTLVDGSNMTILHNEDFVVIKKENSLNPEDYGIDDDEPEDTEAEGEEDEG